MRAGMRTEPKSKSSMQEHLELVVDLIALAFQTDMTGVVTQYLGGEAGPGYDEYEDWAGETGAPTRGIHDDHHNGSGNRVEDNPDTRLIGRRDRFFCACLAHLMDRLDTIETGDATLLDHMDDCRVLIVEVMCRARFVLQQSSIDIRQSDSGSNQEIRVWKLN